MYAPLLCLAKSDPMLSSFKTFSLGKLPNSLFDAIVVKILVSTYPRRLQYSRARSSSLNFVSFISIDFTVMLISGTPMFNMTSCCANFRFFSPDSEYESFRKPVRFTNGDMSPSDIFLTIDLKSSEGSMSFAKPEVSTYSTSPVDDVGIVKPDLTHSM